MKFVISSSELSKHLQAVAKVINSKNTLPILDNFLFNVEGNTLTITGSDLETTLITKIELDNVEGEGVIAVEVNKLLNLLRLWPELPLSFSVDEEKQNVNITSETGKYSLPYMDGAEFPKIPEFEGDFTTVKYTGDVLVSGIEKTLFATADDELRPVMNGIFFEIEEGKTTFVASDSHKLVRYIRTDVDAKAASSFILPKKPAGIIKNSLSKDDTIIEVNFDQKNAVFKYDEFTLVARLVEGTYPSYNSVIPTDLPNKLLVDRLAFLNKLKLVTVLANQASFLVKLKVTPNKLFVSAQDVDFASAANEEIDCHYEGEDMEIGFKGPFLQDILSNLASADVVLQLHDPSRAGILVPNETETEAEDVLMLIMPMML